MSKDNDIAKALRAQARAIRRHTNSQKNCCGCLIILLSAPLWIPALLAFLASLN